MKKVTCHISKKEVSESEAQKGDQLRPSLYNLIKQEHTDFSNDSYISNEELNKYRNTQLSQLISNEKGQLSLLEKEVINAISSSKILSENIDVDIEEKLTFGQRLADSIATFGGSWPFIIIFFSFLFSWIAINVWFLSAKPFDPYPFILLNLILSCLASIQAPIIMMSQNRQEHKDRLRSQHDYKVNLKAELEIKILNEKVDYLLIHQSKTLMEIQQIQADYLEDILKKLKAK
jgi:uncharacterized membrane protein